MILNVIPIDDTMGRLEWPKLIRKLSEPTQTNFECFSNNCSTEIAEKDKFKKESKIFEWWRESEKEVVINFQNSLVFPENLLSVLLTVFLLLLR